MVLAVVIAGPIALHSAVNRPSSADRHASDLLAGLQLGSGADLLRTEDPSQGVAAAEFVVEDECVVYAMDVPPGLAQQASLSEEDLTSWVATSRAEERFRSCMIFAARYDDGPNAPHSGSSNGVVVRVSASCIV